MDYLSQLAALCSRREYCESDIMDKLNKKEFPSQKSAKILQYLRDNKYIDNSRYAKAFAKDKSLLAGWGEKKIIFQLKGKKISDEDIKEALNELDKEQSTKKMEDVLLRKWELLAKEKESYTRGLKVLRFALGRGYGYQEASEWIEKIKIK
jgi:regulatory protein